MIGEAVSMMIACNSGSRLYEAQGQCNKANRLEIPRQFKIYETEHWLINHRIDSALPGYLMVSSTEFVHELIELSEDALSSLGPLLAKTQDVMRSLLLPGRVYIGRYGHTSGNTFHFHLIPIYDWVEELFWQDARYRALEKLAESSGASATDGAELTLFVWREFCERSAPPTIKGPSVLQTIEMLKAERRHE